MPRYRVEYKETRTFVVEVDAADPEEAGELATQAEGTPISDQFDSADLISVDLISVKE
jgi:hypothetical protein